MWRGAPDRTFRRRPRRRRLRVGAALVVVVVVVFGALSVGVVDLSPFRPALSGIKVIERLRHNLEARRLRCDEPADAVLTPLELECAFDCCGEGRRPGAWPAPRERLNVLLLAVHGMQDDQFRTYFSKLGHAVDLMPGCVEGPDKCFSMYTDKLAVADVVVVDTNQPSVDAWRQRLPYAVLLGGIHGHYQFGKWDARRYPSLDAVLYKRCCDAGRFPGGKPHLVVPYTMDKLAARVRREWQPRPASPDINSYVNDYCMRFPVQCKQFLQVQAAVPHVVRFDTEVKHYTHDDIGSMLASKFTLHIKGDGYMCNAVGRSLAVGIPVVMDRRT